LKECCLSEKPPKGAQTTKALEGEIERLREERRGLVQERRKLEKQVERALGYRYGSFTPGVAGWDERWDACRGRRVLFLAFTEMGGSLQAWAEAINRCTDDAARVVVFRTHPWFHRADLVMPDPSLGKSRLEELLRTADIIHLKDERGFFDGSNRLPRDLYSRHGKLVVFTLYGSWSRRLQDDPAFRAFVAGFDARVATTADLLFPWLDGSLVPFALDLEAFEPCWRDGQVLGHAPSRRELKGTADLLAAFEQVRKELGLELELIEGVSQSECLERMRRCSLYFDQAAIDAEAGDHGRLIGVYGKAAMEAAAFGIPVVAHLSPAFFAGCRKGGQAALAERCPLLDTPLGPDGIAHTLRAYFALEPAERAALSRRARAWVEEFHSLEAVARVLGAVYDRL
jgi:glycosyltransferase involved in cell wall biosynthesis